MSVGPRTMQSWQAQFRAQLREPQSYYLPFGREACVRHLHVQCSLSRGPGLCLACVLVEPDSALFYVCMSASACLNNSELVQIY